MRLRSVAGAGTVVGIVIGMVAASVLPAAGETPRADKPQAVETGVTASEVHIAVAADVDNPLAPGLFKGAVDGVRAAAQWVNTKAGGGGVAGRKLVVDFYDSKLSPNETRNAAISSCQNDLAMVGTTVLFLTNVSDIVGCTDKAGQATGLPDIPAIATGIPETCSPVTFPAGGSAIDCSTVNQPEQTYFGNQGEAKWLLKTHKDLHGPMIVSNDTKDANRGGVILSLTNQQAGIKPDSGSTIAKSGRDPQSAYTSVVKQMQSDGSNYSLVTAAVQSSLELRNEAQIQGIDSSKVVWDSVSAYGNKLVTDNAQAFEGEYQALQFLPFEEAKVNKTLGAFVKYMKKVGGTPDQFSAYAFESVLAFKAAADAAVQKNGVNGLTRANLIAGIKTLTDFDAGGMAGTHSFKTNRLTNCFVVVQFKRGKWVRQYPTKKGTFDCKPSNSIQIKANLLNGG